MTRAIIAPKLTDRDCMYFYELNFIADNHEFMTELAVKLLHYIIPDNYLNLLDLHA